MDYPSLPSFDNSKNTAEWLTEMFVGIAQDRRIQLGQYPAERAVFRKLHGVASAQWVLEPNIPSELRVGIFTHERLQAWIRFSSDTTPTSPDLKSTLGIAIKLFGVPGVKALGDDGDTADFIMQNFPVFFVDNAQEMTEFTYAGVVQKDYPSYLKKYPKTADILNRMAKVEGSALTATYWAILPFMAGQDRFVKYRLDPVTQPVNIPDDKPDYLAVDMCNRLLHDDYKFKFMVQLRTNPDAMPLDQVTVEWSTAESPFLHVATLTIPRQDINLRGQAEYGQGLSYNIWRVPHEQAPVGSIAEARKVVYREGARLRHEANGQSLQDPTQPRLSAPSCPFHQAKEMLTECVRHTERSSDTFIVKAAIYPSIGLARVGNSPDEWFLGPEVPDPEPMPAGSYRDAQHRLKRQAARFRIFGLNLKGEIVRELTAEDADIEWSVHLANQKAAWYGFQLALDIPEAASAPPTTLRNQNAPNRDMLSISPKPQKVSGKNANAKRFNDGQFMGKPVYLGEIHTDENGRLVVLGGRGHSSSYNNSKAITFGNNEGWHDDVSDGPVTAKVKYQGFNLTVDPAWVVVAPPNYGPQLKTVRTMWDLMRDVAITNGMLPKPTRPSFALDIYPLFKRLHDLQWVNSGFAAGFGWNGANDLTSPKILAKLSSASPAFSNLRKTIANQFRNDDVDAWSPKPWPWLYGDAMSVPATHTPSQNTSLTKTQLKFLQQWAMGDFIEDYDPAQAAPSCIEEVPLADQGDTLTRAALDFCLADAFHPGCEMTWPVRIKTMYMAPFRFAHAADDWTAPSIGEVLSSDWITIPNGPFSGQKAGGLTRWMAVPWQTDTASCRSGYDKAYDPYVPSFWPARVPNQVLTQQNYSIVMDTTKSLGERMMAFANRAAWTDPLGDSSYTDQINNMVDHFDHMGVVEAREGPEDQINFPAVIQVEDERRSILNDGHVSRRHRSEAKLGSAGEICSDSVDLMTIEKLRRFPRL